MQNFRKLQKMLSIIQNKIEKEAVENGEDISSPEFQEGLLKLKEKILEEKGSSLMEYELMQESIKSAKTIKLEEEKKSGSEVLQRISMLKGEKGDSPVKGKDYFTDEEIKQFKKEVTPIKGKDYFDGKDGRNPIYIGKYPPTNPKKGDLWYKED
jgi:hypothetical protein